MQTPIQIAFEGMQASDSVRDSIAAHVAELKQRFRRIMACRVSIKAPNERQRSGGLFEVHVRLALPNGREVNVDRTPSADERLSDVRFAINDAFHHARRQLQDYVGELHGRTRMRLVSARATAQHWRPF